jgi:hypothetical protein
MKINGRAIARSVLAFILTATAFSIIGFIVDPQLIEYTSENLDLLSNQRNFALASIAIGAMSAILLYPKK